MMAASGVHLAQFESFNSQHLWLPCPENAWCANFRDRLATSIINAKKRALYFGEGKGGIIFDPMHVRIHCAYPGDGSSQDKLCSPIGGGPGSSMKLFGTDVDLNGGECVPGCYPDGMQCGQTGAGELGSCSYPSERLCESMRTAEGGFAQGTNNEIILDTIRSHFGNAQHGEPPPAIAGFFITGTGDDVVREARKAFLRTYRLEEQGASAAPLVRLSLHGDPAFALA